MMTMRPTHSGKPIVDDDVTELIATSFRSSDAITPDEGLSARLFSRVLATIAENTFDSHTTVRAKSGVWMPFLDGVEIKILHTAADTASYLLKMQAGSSLPIHSHGADEECLVLEGDLYIGDELALGAGDYHRAARGVPHAKIATRGGALLYLRGDPPERVGSYGAA